MTPGIFFTLFAILIACELLKGLSANGTPPVLQKFSWQLDLAHFMWSNIRWIRSVLIIALVIAAFLLPADSRGAWVVGGGVLLALLWAFIYWLFNHYWCGRVKFLPLENPRFASRADNEIDLSEQIIGVSHNGEQRAYPVSMIFYHHQFGDQVGGHPVTVTYCGMCQSGRVYDNTVDGKRLDFQLVGAINFNAILKDLQTGSWWRQETGEAVKGHFAGRALEDMPMDQMSLEKWLERYPDSLILQQDPNPAFQQKYRRFRAFMNYEASLPAWHFQEQPPLVIGLQINHQSHAYDWINLQKRRLVNDVIGGASIVVLSSEDGSSPFAYDRTVDGQVLEFEITGDEMTDTTTQSKWDLFGRCTAGAKQGSQLDKVQIYQQFVRAWNIFHPDSTFYQFQANPQDTTQVPNCNDNN